MLSAPGTHRAGGANIVLSDLVAVVTAASAFALYQFHSLRFKNIPRLIKNTHQSSVSNICSAAAVKLKVI